MSGSALSPRRRTRLREGVRRSRVIHEVRTLDEINYCVEDVEKGHHKKARIVFDLR